MANDEEQIRFLSLIYDTVLEADESTTIERLLESLSYSSGDVPVSTKQLEFHLLQAEKIRKTLQRSQLIVNDYITLIDKLPFGILAVDYHGAIIKGNRQAIDELTKHRAIFRNDIGNITAVSSSDDVQLQQTIRKVLEFPDQRHILSFKVPDSTVELHLMIIHAGHTFRFFCPNRMDPLALIIFATEPLTNGITKQTLLDSTLTDSEARTVLAFAGCPNIRKLSENIHKSEHTIRIQLKSAYRKLNVHSQGELIKLLLDYHDTKLPDLFNPSFQQIRPPEETHLVKIPNGGKISYCEYGDLTGKPVVYFHSATGGRLECAFATNSLKKTHLHLIAPDRPGYGQSRINTGISSFMEYAPIFATFLNQLGVNGPVTLLAFSGGSAYALAFALAYPRRVQKIVLVSPMGEVQNFKDIKGMMPLNRRIFTLALRMPDRLTEILAQITAGIFLSNAEKYFQRIYPHLPPEDRAVLDDPEKRHHLKYAFKEALSKKPSTLSRELVIYSHPWFLRLEELEAPVYLLHGKNNRHIPLQLAQRLANKIPRCQSLWLQGGYYLNHSHWEQVLRILREQI